MDPTVAYSWQRVPCLWCCANSGENHRKSRWNTDIASQLAGLQLVAEEDHVVGFDHRVDVNLGYSGNDETSPIGFCNVDHVMDLVPISVENPFTISVLPRSHIHNYMGIPVDLCHQVWVDLSIVINPDLLSPGQVSFEHIFLEI